MAKLSVRLSIRYTPTFVRMYKGLPTPLKEEIKEKIAKFQDERNHAALKVHKLKGPLRDTYAFSVNFKIRIVFEFDSALKNTANLLLVGAHDVVYI